MEGDTRYEVKVSASTKSLSRPPKVRVGELSEKETVYLPMKSCDNIGSPVTDAPETTDPKTGELSAGMIGGAICAALFLMLAVIGFIVWR